MQNARTVFEYSEQNRHEALEQLGQWIRQGRLRIIQEHRHGFDQLRQAFIDLLAGRSSGSQVVWIDGLN
ncbi:zinc-binding dehydrogenase [Bradyrhizobium sp. AZCC 2289]|uniref:zinc-binding dehydrogenase n=1 Tax=Bradyrhizobium sp. AZCC 2289 TaxID=3117026 RepID=UPI002FF13325